MRDKDGIPVMSRSGPVVRTRDPKNPGKVIEQKTWQQIRATALSRQEEGAVPTTWDVTRIYWWEDEASADGDGQTGWWV